MPVKAWNTFRRIHKNLEAGELGWWGDMIRIWLLMLYPFNFKPYEHLTIKNEMNKI